MNNGKKRDEKNEIAQQVRDVIAKIPPLKGVKLDINPQGIFGTDVAGKIWWRVPLIATPRPRRLSALCEVSAEIEDELETISKRFLVAIRQHFGPRKKRCGTHFCAFCCARLRFRNQRKAF